MKHGHIFKAIVIIVFLITASCNDDFLETRPLDGYADPAVWGDLSLVENYINEAYSRISEPFTSGRTLGMIVDEGHYRSGYQGPHSHTRSLLTPDDIPGWSMLTRYRSWPDLYASIRICNVFFGNLDNIPAQTPEQEALKSRLTGEAYFLRAKFYHHLTKVFGGVPIVDRAYAPGEDFNIARSSYEDCVEFMVNDLDMAATLLPLTHTGAAAGRATKGAAMALKARILMFAASDLYNTEVFPGYLHRELIGYTGGNQQQRWQRARDAAKEVIDLGVYSLYNRNPDPVQNYVEYFISRETEEDIFWRYYTSAIWNRNIIGRTSESPGWFGGGFNTPLGDLVDDMEMADGSKFDWGNPEHAALPYENREPRFYANILYDGATWRPRDAGLTRIDPIGIVQTGGYEEWDETTNSIIIEHGLDSPGSKDIWLSHEASYTGYYLRKFSDPAKLHLNESQDGSYRWLRYGEILLNYAEACIELGDFEEARTYINMVRDRAGLPGVTESGNELRERYRKERRIELMFEDHRYFDVRRWVIGPEAYDKEVSAVEIVYELQEDKTTAEIPTVTAYKFEKWEWHDRAYFHPILRTEMLRNDLLVQNPYYE